MTITDFSNISFAVEDGDLVMHAIAKATGQPYRHACPLESFTAIAHAVDEAGSHGVTRQGLHQATGIAWTRINVALLFLSERSIVERSGKRGRVYSATSGTAYEDAVVEYHALREKPAR